MVDEITARAVELLGQAEPVSRQPRKETLMSFREGHLFMALKLVTPFDKVSQTYLDSIPKIVLMVDGKYVRMPVDGDLIGSFGDFLCRMSEALEGVKVPSKEIDMVCIPFLPRVKGCEGRLPCATAPLAQIREHSCFPPKKA